MPIIISSDETQLTVFRGKKAYPIYLTIGNVPKDIRRKPSRHAQILLGYIPSTKLEAMSNRTARRRALANLFHFCMRTALEPIASKGDTGIPIMSADRKWHRCHPIFAIFVGDYPEQALVTCTYNGRCSKCSVSRDELGEFRSFPKRIPGDAIDTYRLVDVDVRAFHRACREAGLKPVFHPFWMTLPFADVFLSITPDILHQLLQGVMKYIVVWLASPTVFGSSEIDARCRALPPNHNTTLFMNGITTLSHVSGQEHKNMCRILLGLILDLPLPGGQVPSRVIKAVRAALDFLYLAQYMSHTSETFRRLDDALVRFHDNKAIFIDLGTRDGFNIPKFHSLLHYQSSITLFGTTDNYNTEQTERLHIDFAKDAYRATNRKDEYFQMTLWLERREKMQRHTEFIKRQEGGETEHLRTNAATPIGPPVAFNGRLRMTQRPTIKAVSFDTLARKYGAADFQDVLADFIARINNPGATAVTLRARAEDTLIPFRAVPVFHKIRFISTGDCDNSKEVTMDAVHVRPEQLDPHGRIVPSRFDTVLINNGNHILQIAQVRVVFQIPSSVTNDVFPSPNAAPVSHLAYVEWFSPLPATPDPIHGMYRVSRLMQNGRRCAGIIPVGLISCSVHLFPRFGPTVPQNWDNFTVLEHCNSFYVNPFSSRHSYLTFA